MPPVNPRVLRVVVAVMLFGGVAAFVGLFGYFFWDIWQARLAHPIRQKPPKLDKDLLYVASLIGGILGTYFAVVLGVQKRDPNIDEKKLRLGSAILPGHRLAEALGTFAFLVYFVVGTWSLLTFAICKVQSPDIIKTDASAFGGYILALLGAAFIGTTAPPPAR
jgi:hypothetical protein